jgi:hypothetical protein
MGGQGRKAQQVSEMTRDEACSHMKQIHYLLK